MKPRTRIFLIATGLVVGSLAIFYGTATAWHADSVCVGGRWLVSNPENEDMTVTPGGDVAPGGGIYLPADTQTVTVSWPTDPGPFAVTRPANCQEATPSSTSTSVASSTSTPTTSTTSTTSPTSPTSTTSPPTTVPSPETSVAPPSSTSVAPSTTSSPTTTEAGQLIPPASSNGPPAPPSVTPTPALPTTGPSSVTLAIAGLAAMFTACGAALVWRTRRES